MAKDAYWFRHDANARNDIKIIELRSLHGYEGYGIYFAILEVMREQTEYVIPEKKIGMVGLAIGESPQKVRQIIEDCVAVGLFENDDGNIYSPSFLDRMSKWEGVKNRNETNGAKGGRPKKKPNNNPNETQNKPRRGEERREEDRRGEDKDARASVSQNPTLEECKTAAEMSGFTQEQGDAYYHFRNATGWLVPRGKEGMMHPIANWRSDLNIVIGRGWLDKNPKGRSATPYLDTLDNQPFR